MEATADYERNRRRWRGVPIDRAAYLHGVHRPLDWTVSATNNSMQFIVNLVEVCSTYFYSVVEGQLKIVAVS